MAKVIVYTTECCPKCNKLKKFPGSKFSTFRSSRYVYTRSPDRAAFQRNLYSDCTCFTDQ